jgi:hypothetical protein
MRTWLTRLPPVSTTSIVHWLTDLRASPSAAAMTPRASLRVITILCSIEKALDVRIGSKRRHDEDIGRAVAERLNVSIHGFSVLRYAMTLSRSSALGTLMGILVP